MNGYADEELERRRLAAIQTLGKRWLLHLAHAPQRIAQESLRVRMQRALDRQEALAASVARKWEE